MQIQVNNTFIACGRYYEGEHQRIAHEMKEGQSEAIKQAAKDMARLIPSNAVLVPIPNHEGRAKQTLRLVEEIARLTHLPIADVIQGKARKSQYKAKREGRSLSASDMGFKLVGNLPSGRVPYICDNVIDTCTTAKAALDAVGYGKVIAYAMNIN